MLPSARQHVSTSARQHKISGHANGLQRSLKGGPPPSPPPSSALGARAVAALAGGGGGGGGGVTVDVTVVVFNLPRAHL